MNFTSRSYDLELLDNPGIPFDDIRRNMQELNFINTWLGGHAITIEGIKKFISVPADNNKTWHICEIGCGGADNIRAISEWGRKRNVRMRFTGIDINPHCIGLARTAALQHQADFILSDYKEAVFASKPDIIFSSLFCHHFRNEDLVFMMQWMINNSSKGFFINDLHRNFLAYHSIKILAFLFSKSYLVKNDAPLSVVRGFSRQDILSLLNSAGATNFRVFWKWAFRWLVICRKQNTFQ